MPESVVEEYLTFHCRKFCPSRQTSAQGGVHAGDSALLPVIRLEKIGVKAPGEVRVRSRPQRQDDDYVSPAPASRKATVRARTRASDSRKFSNHAVVRLQRLTSPLPYYISQEQTVSLKWNLALTFSVNLLPTSPP